MCEAATEVSENDWLILSPEVYVNESNGCVFLYNTSTGNRIETDDVEHLAIIQKLHLKHNLGCIELLKEYKNNPDIMAWIEHAVEKRILHIETRERYPQKPVVLMPVLNLRVDVNKYGREDVAHIGNEILINLSQIYLYLNADCSLNCVGCQEYYKQAIFCKCNKDLTKMNNLHPKIIDQLLHELKYSMVGTVNILGGDISKYEYINELDEVLNKYDFEFRFWCHYKNLNNIEQWVSRINKYHIEILVNFPLEDNVLVDHLPEMVRERYTFHFLIENEIHFEKVENMIANGVEHVRIIPYFNGTNNKFLEDYVFVRTEDLFKETIEQRVIFRNQKLNANYFGVLNVMENGDVYANVNKAHLGNLHADSILKIIYDEMLSISSWRDIRSMKPCSECLYQFVCPPPSNYEYAIGKYNLCHIKK
jgi:pseudo-rSAM protein